MTLLQDFSFCFFSLVLSLSLSFSLINAALYGWICAQNSKPRVTPDILGLSASDSVYNHYHMQKESIIVTNLGSLGCQTRKRLVLMEIIMDSGLKYTLYSTCTFSVDLRVMQLVLLHARIQCDEHL